MNQRKAYHPFFYRLSNEERANNGNVEEDNPWYYIPFDDYKKPSIPIDETIRKRYKKIANKLFRISKSKEFQALDNLKLLPKSKINSIVPNPDWAQAIDALNKLLANWLENKEESKLFFLISHPQSKNDEILEQWAIKNNIGVLPFPKFDQISNASTWFSDNSELIKNKFVITKLESYFLKHHYGLNLIRGLFERIDKQELKCIIGINSWAFAYLNEINIISHKVSNNVFIAKAFDAGNFKVWLKELTRQSARRKFIYRKTNDGSYLIHPDITSQDHNADATIRKFDDKLFTYLTSYNFGIPNLTLQMWKNSLRATPGDDFFNKEDSEDIENKNVLLEDQSYPTIWVLPWDQISKPIVGSKLTNTEMVILHLILIHGELTSSKVGYLLGETFQDQYFYLKKMVDLGLLVRENSTFDLNPIAYREVALLLKSEGYLSDNLV